MLHDTRIALRLLAKDAAAFTATAGLTLAVCIGANIALFSIVDHVLLEPLPIPHSERIVLMANTYPNAGAGGGTNSSVPDYYDRLRETDVFDEQALYRPTSVSLDQNGTPVRVRMLSVTPPFFRLVDAVPFLGRTFTEAEAEPGNDTVIVLGYGLWQKQFGGDPTAVGRRVRVDGRQLMVVGVMPRAFQWVEPDTVAWLPLAIPPEQKEDSRRHGNGWSHIGRLKTGATVAQAQAEIDALNARNLERFPQYKQLLIDTGFRTLVIRLRDLVVRDIRSTLYLMWAGALFVLLIGVVNVANLVLVRARARSKELVTRLALGATRLRLARQLVIESVLLTTAAAAGGLAVGAAGLRVWSALGADALPRGTDVRIDAAVALYAIALAAVIGVALGLIPVGSALSEHLTTALRDEGRGGTAGRGTRTLRRVLVVAQVGFAFVLLVGAGLLFASFRAVLGVDPGFNPLGVMTAAVALPPSRYPDDVAIRGFTAEALRRLRAIPGVAAAGATSDIPFSGSNNDSVILAEGYQLQPGESLISPLQVGASPGYFDAMGAHVLAGRSFDDRDGAGAPRVVIVDDRLARHFWPGRNPIGRRMYRPTDINHVLAVTPATEFLTVVGVVRDIKTEGLAARASVGTTYFPLEQQTARNLFFALRTTADPFALAPSVRQAVQSLDRELPVFGLETMTQRTETSLMARRTPLQLAILFGCVALFLSALGIYGVLAYLVTLRTREIGIRIALGGTSGSIVELVLREGLLLVGVGLLAGAAALFAVRTVLQSQLFGVAATDPLVLAGTTALLGAVAAAACAVPAWRATRIDPVVALTT